MRFFRWLISFFVRAPEADPPRIEEAQAPAAPRAMPPYKERKLSTDWIWDKHEEQLRIHVPKKAVTDLISVKPYPVEQMSLKDWETINNGQGKNGVRCGEGPICGFTMDDRRFPDTKSEIYPVLIGQAGGRKFIIDGAHRVAAWKSMMLPSIIAIILSEEDTRACVRPGMMEQFETKLGIR